MSKNKITQGASMFWEQVLAEVLNKKNNNGFLQNQEQSFKKPKCIKNYFLGKKLKNLYLTKREAECMLLLLKGKTINGIAIILNLSPRTIEFYLKKMKIKLNCRTKFELIELIIHSDFNRNLDFDL